MIQQSFLEKCTFGRRRFEHFQREIEIADRVEIAIKRESEKMVEIGKKRGKVHRYTYMESRLPSSRKTLFQEIVFCILHFVHSLGNLCLWNTYLTFHLSCK